RGGRARGPGQDPAALDGHGVRSEPRSARGGDGRVSPATVADPVAIEEVFARVPLLAHLSGRQRTRLAELATTRLYEQGSIIVRQGDTSMALYVVLSGHA